jgi:hypothetical protein
MSDHPDSTTTFKSLGELTGNIVRNLKKPDDGEVASAMRDLETQVHDFAHMAAIMADMADHMLGRAHKQDAEDLHFKLGRSERDRFIFAINNVEARADKFKADYLAAFDGRAPE